MDDLELFEKRGVLSSVGVARRGSQPMVISRHPRHRTGVHTDAVTISSGTPGPPIITAILDQPPGRAAHSLAPPGRLKRVLKAHLHLGDLLPDPLVHTRRHCLMPAQNTHTVPENMKTSTCTHDMFHVRCTPLFSTYTVFEYLCVTHQGLAVA